MKRYLTYLSNNLKFLAAVMVAAAVGGATTGAVMASIPGGDGDLYSCYKTVGGALRVIDNQVESCAEDETAMNLSQVINNDVTASFKINDGAIDAASLQNIKTYQWYDGSLLQPWDKGYCIETSFDPSIGLGIMPNSSFDNISLKSQGTDQESIVNDHCASNFNAFMYLGNEFDNVAAWFSK